MLAVAVLAPRWLRRLLSRTTAYFVYALAPPLRRRLLRNQRALQPGIPAAEARQGAIRVLQYYGRYLLDFFSLLRGSRLDLIGSYSSPRSFEDLLETGRGVILATAHIGSWEIAAYALSLHGADVSVVSEGEEIEYLGDLRTNLRERMKHREILVDEGPHATIGLMERLRAGGMVGLQLDRGGRGSRVTSVPFLGGRLRMPCGPARLAVLTEAFLLPTFAIFNEHGTYDIIAEEPIDPRGQTEEEIQLQLAALVERYVRRYPEQWLMVQDPWDVHPEELPSSPPAAPRAPVEVTA